MLQLFAIFFSKGYININRFSRSNLFPSFSVTGRKKMETGVTALRYLKPSEMGRHREQMRNRKDKPGYLIASRHLNQRSPQS